MPLYEYECEACGHRFERIQKFSDPLVEVCPNCGKKKVHKLVSSPAIKFKGSGFYINDYARQPKTDQSADGPKARATDAEKPGTERHKACEGRDDKARPPPPRQRADTPRRKTPRLRIRRRRLHFPERR